MAKSQDPGDDEDQKGDEEDRHERREHDEQCAKVLRRAGFGRDARRPVDVKLAARGEPEHNHREVVPATNSYCVLDHLSGQHIVVGRGDEERLEMSQIQHVRNAVGAEHELITARTATAPTCGAGG